MFLLEFVCLIGTNVLDIISNIFSHLVQRLLKTREYFKLPYKPF